MLRTKNKSVLSVLLALVMLIGVAALVVTVSAPNAEAYSLTAGTYYVRVFWNTTNTKDDGDNYYTIYYKKQDGSNAETSFSNTTKNSGEQSHDHAIDGVPYAIKMQVWGRSTAAAEWYVTKVTVSPNSNYTSNATTLWAGKLGGKKARVGGEGSACTLTFPNSFTSFSNHGVDNEAKTSSSYYSSSANNYYPRFESLPLTGGSTSLTTKEYGNNTNVNSDYWTATPYDQFGVVWGQDVTYTWSQSTKNYTRSGIEQHSSNKNQARVYAQAPTEAIAAQDNTVKVSAVSGSTTKTATKTIRINPTYKINFNVTQNAANCTPSRTSIASATVTNTNTNSPNVTYTVESGKTVTKTDAYGNVWQFAGWATDTTSDTGIDVGAGVTIDAANDTIYATYKLDIGYKYHYLNASGEQTRVFVDTIYNNATSTDNVTGFQAVTSTGKLNNISYTFVGWSTDGTETNPANVTNAAKYSVATNEVTYDATNKRATRDMYGLFSAVNTGNFYYYDSTGTRVIKDVTSALGYMNLGGSQTTATFTAPAAPVAQVTGADGKTYTFYGWRKDNTNVPSSDLAVGGTDVKALRSTGYPYFAVYTNDVTMSYNVNQRYADGSDAVTGTVPSNSVSQFTVANQAKVSDAAHSTATIAINPDGVALTREGAEAFVGWSAIDGGADTELETATYAATGATMNITTDTVLTAVFRDSRKTVTFVKPDGSAIDTRTVRYNYGVNTTDGDFATPSSTISGVGSFPVINPAAVADHKDANNHYYFNGWTRNNDQNEFYGNVNDGFTFNRVKADVQFTASYTAQAHKWQQDDLATAAVSCNGEAGEGHAFVDGGYHRYCTVCEYGKNDTAPDFSDNTLVEIKAVGEDYLMVLNNRPATCTAYGSTGKTVCKLCFKTLSDATQIEPNGVYNEAAKRWEHKLVQVTDPERVPADANYTLWECSECGHEERHYIAAEHTLVFVAKADATCTEEGYTVDHFLCTDADCGKLFADVEATEELEASAVVIAPLGHDFQFALAKPATCTEPGYEEGYVCSRCGELQDPEKLIPATGHPADKLSTEEGFAATCTKPGKEDYVVCTLCNTVLSGGEEIPATGHKLSGIRVELPTCTAAGKSYRFCENVNCDVDEATEGYQAYEESNTTLPALGHDLVLKKGKAATCTEAGTKDCYECRRCGLLYSDEAGENAIDLPETVEALGHDLSTQTYPPTCTEAGYTLTTCSRCDYSERTEGAEALGHTGGTATCKDKAVCDVCGKSYGNYASHVWDEGAVTSEGDCQHRKVTTYTCTVCGATKTEKGGYGDHDYWVVSQNAATCTAQGHVVRRCNVCGDETDEITDALGHSVSEWHLDGTVAKGTCSRCGQEVTTTPAEAGLTHKCEKCGLIHEGRTGIFVQDGLYCKIIGFFRRIFGMFSR